MGKGCGGGGLRLLPHKSWNVWNRDNVARVDRDERQHEQHQRHQQQRERQAQHTQRITALHNPPLSPHGDDDVAQPAERPPTAEQRGREGGASKAGVSGQQSFGQFAVEGGQPWYLRDEHEKAARQGRHERALVEQKQQRGKADAVLQRIRAKVEERKEEEEAAATGAARHVRLAELLGSERKESDDPLDVMRYYVQRTKEHQRLHEILPDSPPSHTATIAGRPVKRQHDHQQQPADVIELSSGGDESGSDGERRHNKRRRHTEKRTRRYERGHERRRHEDEEKRRERKRRKSGEREVEEADDEEEDGEEARRREERRTQIVALLNQLDNKAVD